VLARLLTGECDGVREGRVRDALRDGGRGGERGGGTGETLRGCDGFEFLVDSGFGYWKRVLLDSFGTCGPID